jgi:hypothetical protein
LAKGGDEKEAKKINEGGVMNAKDIEIEKLAF